MFAAPSLNGNGNGEARLRGALAAFFNTYFRPVHAVRPEHVVVTAGATEAIENVIFAVCDEGDSVLVAGPHWREFEQSFSSSILSLSPWLNFVFEKKKSISRKRRERRYGWFDWDDTFAFYFLRFCLYLFRRSFSPPISFHVQY